MRVVWVRGRGLELCLSSVLAQSSTSTHLHFRARLNPTAASRFPPAHTHTPLPRSCKPCTAPTPASSPLVTTASCCTACPALCPRLTYASGAATMAAVSGGGAAALSSAPARSSLQRCPCRSLKHTTMRCRSACVCRSLCLTIVCSGGSISYTRHWRRSQGGKPPADAAHQVGG